MFDANEDRIDIQALETNHSRRSYIAQMVAHNIT
jgi:hypothetical protein